MSSQFFSRSYREARERLLQAAKRCDTLTDHQAFDFSCVAARDLVTDYYLFRSKKPQAAPNRRLVIVNSGLHGIEGYAGSALQLGLINSWQEAPRNHDLLIIHALNPYGFHFNRRYNAQRIDLNRNCILPGEDLSNPAYDRVRNLLNSRIPLVGRGFRQNMIMLGLMARVAVNQSVIKAAFLAGQYTDPTGLFFGGDTLCPEMAALNGYILKLAANYDGIVHLDIHTGYGERGHMHLLCPSQSGRDAWLNMGFLPEDEGLDGADYKTTGNMLAYVEHHVRATHPAVEYLPLLVEFGTNGTDWASQYQSIKTLIADNSIGMTQSPDESFLELFNPPCPRWRHDVVQNGLTLAKRIAESFKPHIVQSSSNAPKSIS